MRTNTIPLLLFVVGLTLISWCGDAAWNVQVSTTIIGSLERTLSTGGSSSLVRINMVHDEVQFLDSLANDRTIFPASCTSTSLNKYGWNTYKDRLFDSLFVSGSTLQLRLKAVDGFSPTETETVACSVGLTGADGTSFVKAGALSSGDRTVSFQITSESSLIRAVLETVDASGAAVALSVSPTPLSEIIMREYGFTLNVVIYGDVWDQTKKSVLINGLTCTSSIAAGCTWFNSIKNDASYVSLNDAAPQKLSIYVPRTVTRTIDIDAALSIELSVPDLTTVRYGLKSSPAMSLFDSDRKFVFSIAPTTPSLLIRPTKKSGSTVTFAGSATTSLTLTEDCIRGVNTTDACAMALWIVTDAGTSLSMEFRSTTIALGDLDQTALKSSRLGIYLNIFKNIELIYSVVGTRNRALQAILSLNALYSYDIATNDLLTFYVPYSMYSADEPASTTIPITVIPSSGEVDTSRTTVRNIFQRDLWVGGFTFRIAIGGETFKSTVAGSLVLSYSSGAIGGSTGWTQYRRCTLPSGAVYFEDSTYNSIILNFTACSGYIQNVDEVVTISFSSSATTTGLSLQGQSALVFTIVKTPGVFVLNGGSKTFLEAEIQEGNVSLTFSLQGGETFVPAGTVQWDACIVALIGAWNSSVSRDVDAWISLPVRTALFSDGAVQRVSDTEMNIHFNRSAYNTRKGEVISFASFPGECLTFGVSLLGFTSYSMTILPRQGEVRLGYQYPSEPIVYDIDISESMMRRGGFAWVVEAINDEFDEEKVATLPGIVLNDLVTDSLEPNGFLAQKDQLLSTASVQFVDGPEKWKRIYIHLNSVIKFDVRNNETIVVNVTGDWMASGRSPTNYEEAILIIYKSAGDIVLTDWYGANQTVTEENVRSGDIWFKFGLLGDQWRAERPPYVEAFKSTDTSATAFTALRDTIIPSIEFFEFESSDSYEFLTLRFQSNGDYDIFQDETISIEFPASTVIGDVSPFFSGAGVVDGIKTIDISVTPGTIILSGDTNLNEKKIRQGGISMFLTLFGEKWSTSIDPALCVRHNMRLSTTSTDQQLNESILPYSSSGTTQSDIVALQDNLIKIPFRQYRLYDIDYGMTDRLIVTVPGECVQSSLQPLYRPLLVPILPTEGELRLSSTDPAIIYESDVRTYAIKIVFQLDGDTWNEELQNNPAALVAGFASTSSSVSEPNGFFAARTSLLNLDIGSIPDVRLTSTTLEVSFQPTPSYNINNDETITFSIADPSFVNSGSLPSPSTVSFTVSITVKTIILIIDDSLAGSIKDGRYDTVRLRTLITTMLSSTVDRVSAYVNTTRSDNLLVVPITFQGSPSVIDTRGNTELEEYFMNTKQSYLESTMGIRQLYYADSPPSDSTDGTDGVDGSSSSEFAAGETSMFEVGMWLVGGLSFILLLVGGYLVIMYVKQSKLGGAVRRGTTQSGGKDRYGVVSEEMAALDDIDSPLGDASYYNTSSSYKHSTKLFQDRAEAGKQTAKARVDSRGEGYTDKPLKLHDYAKLRRLQNDPDALKYDTMIEEARQRLVDDDADGNGEAKRLEEIKNRGHVAKAQKLLEGRREREAKDAEEASRMAAANSGGMRQHQQQRPVNNNNQGGGQDESRVRYQRTFDRMMDFYN